MSVFTSFYDYFNREWQAHLSEIGVDDFCTGQIKIGGKVNGIEDDWLLRCEHFPDDRRKKPFWGWIVIKNGIFINVQEASLRSQDESVPMAVAKRYDLNNVNVCWQV